MELQFRRPDATGRGGVDWTPLTYWLKFELHSVQGQSEAGLYDFELKFDPHTALSNKWRVRLYYSNDDMYSYDDWLSYDNPGLLNKNFMDFRA